MLSQFTGLPALFIRKQAKAHGTRRLAEGGEVSGRTALGLPEPHRVFETTAAKP